ncbi:double zinc ribbon domain-containing protein [Alicyclobacillus sp. ALC3]|nr:zinc ribbon domain-containing protein [Alicyclobacillus sp. ALC3]
MNHNFCSNCGYNLKPQPLRCSKCGTEVSGGSFCPNCGNKL